MSDYDEHVALCALNRIFGFHPRMALALKEYAGSALALFTQAPPDCGAHPELLSQLNPDSLEWAVRELEKLRPMGARFIALGEDDYPVPLASCEDPPLGFYIKASSTPTEVFALRPMVGVVGTRDLSPYGRDWCEKIVRTLARSAVTPCIVSGLAFGADAAAHRTALECSIPTVGVMATGVDAVYPWQHRDLARLITEAPGSALISDYPLGTAPVALNFMRRNRIIAGLVRGVVVIESKSKGGSLMTARYAAAYDRDIFALPGRIDDERSTGCNSLIHENMARIITTPQALAAGLGLDGPCRGAGGSWKTGTAGLAAALARRYGEGSLPQAAGKIIAGSRGLREDEIALRLNRPVGEVLAAIGLLEADGFVRTDILRRCYPASSWS